MPEDIAVEYIKLRLIMQGGKNGEKRYVSKCH